MSWSDSGPQRAPSFLAVDAESRVRTLRRGLLPHGRRHKGLFARGLVFTFVLVGSRLALPLPLTAIVERSSTRTQHVTLLGADPVALLAAGFVSLALVAGLAEHFQRLAFAHFAGRSVSDARSTALARVQTGHATGAAPDDLTAEVIADSARVKQGLKGVLNHIFLNGLLVLGGCIALAVADTQLGLVQLAGAGVVLAVAILGATRVAAVAAEHREGEATLAGVLHGLVTHEQGERNRQGLADLHAHDAASGKADVAMTRWEGRTTCAVHVVLTLTAAVVLALGVSATETGRIDTGSLFTIVAYLLLLYGPGVRLARQITRIGPLLVSASHLGLVLVEEPPTDRESSSPA